MKAYAKLYIIGDNRPYELSEATYNAVIRSLDKKFIVLPNGSVVMTASIRNIDTEDRTSEGAQKYDRRGLPPLSESESWRSNELGGEPDPAVIERIKQAKIEFMRRKDEH